MIYRVRLEPLPKNMKFSALNTVNLPDIDQRMAEFVLKIR